MYGRKEKSSTKADKPASKPASEPPRDALAALMEGNTPDKKDLKFAEERSDSFDYPRATAAQKQPKSSAKFDQYGGDHTFARKPDRSQGEYDYQPEDQSTLNSIKTGAAKSGTYVKDRSVAGATYLKEKDWTKEKEMAGKAGQATKTGAVYVGSGVAKGAGWLWNSGKTGVESFTKRGGKE